MYQASPRSIPRGAWRGKCFMSEFDSSSDSPHALPPHMALPRANPPRPLSFHIRKIMMSLLLSLLLGSNVISGWPIALAAASAGPPTPPAPPKGGLNFQQFLKQG